MRKPIRVLAAVGGVLAGCAVTQPAPPQLDLPAPTATAAAERAARALVDRVRRSRCSPRSSTRRSPTTSTCAARSRASRRRARLLLLAQSNLAPSINLRGGAVALARIAEHDAGDRFSHSVRAGEQLRVGLEMSLRARRLGQVSQRGARRHQRPLSPRGTTARPSASRSPPTSRSAYFRLRAADALAAVLEDTTQVPDRHRRRCSATVSTAASSANTTCARPRPSSPPSSPTSRACGSRSASSSRRSRR